MHNDAHTFAYTLKSVATLDQLDRACKYTLSHTHTDTRKHTSNRSFARSAARSRRRRGRRSPDARRSATRGGRALWVVGRLICRRQPNGRPACVSYQRASEPCGSIDNNDPIDAHHHHHPFSPKDRERAIPIYTLSVCVCLYRACV